MVPASEVKPGTINSGFQYGVEVAIVCDTKGGLYGFSNKMPPTGQPTTFGTIEGNCIVEPVTGTQYSLSECQPHPTRQHVTMDGPQEAAPLTRVCVPRRDRQADRQVVPVPHWPAHHRPRHHALACARGAGAR